MKTTLDDNTRLILLQNFCAFYAPYVKDCYTLARQTKKCTFISIFRYILRIFDQHISVTLVTIITVSVVCETC